MNDGIFQVENRQYNPYALTPHAIIKGKGIKAKDIGVYTILSMFANNDTGECYPSLKTLSEYAEMTEKTVLASLKTLKEVGAIDIVARQNADGGKTSNMYILKQVFRVVPMIEQQETTAERNEKKKKAKQELLKIAKRLLDEYNVTSETTRNEVIKAVEKGTCKATTVQGATNYVKKIIANKIEVYGKDERQHSKPAQKSAYRRNNKPIRKEELPTWWNEYEEEKEMKKKKASEWEQEQQREKVTTALKGIKKTKVKDEEDDFDIEAARKALEEELKQFKKQ